MQPVPDEQRAQQWWRRYRQAQRAERGECLEDQMLAAYVSRRLAGDEHERAEHHLAQCARCTGALLEVQRLHASAPVAVPAVLRTWAKTLVPSATRVARHPVMELVHELAMSMRWGLRWSPVMALVTCVCVLGFGLGHTAGAEQLAVSMTVHCELFAIESPGLLASPGALP